MKSTCLLFISLLVIAGCSSELTCRRDQKLCKGPFDICISPEIPCPNDALKDAAEKIRSEVFRLVDAPDQTTPMPPVEPWIEDRPNEGGPMQKATDVYIQMLNILLRLKEMMSPVKTTPAPWGWSTGNGGGWPQKTTEWGSWQSDSSTPNPQWPTGTMDYSAWTNGAGAQTTGQPVGWMTTGSGSELSERPSSPPNMSATASGSSDVSSNPQTEGPSSSTENASLPLTISSTPGDPTVTTVPSTGAETSSTQQATTSSSVAGSTRASALKDEPALASHRECSKVLIVSLAFLLTNVRFFLNL